MNPTQHLPAVSLALLFLALPLHAQGGRGLKFDNAAGKVSTLGPRVEIAHSDSLAPRGGLTLEAWIIYDETTMQTGAGVRYPTIIRKGIGSRGVGEAHTFNFRVNAGGNNNTVLNFALRTIDPGTGANGVTTCLYRFTPGEFAKWTHVAATFDGKEQRIYVNGVEKQRVTTPRPEIYDSTQGKVAIGNGSLKNDNEVWNGELDEVRIWPYARTAAEIQATMNQTLRGSPGGVSSYDLDVIAGTLVLDGSGQNPGTAVALSTANSGGQAVANTLSLPSAKLGASSFGGGTAGCPHIPATGISGPAKVGNTAIALMCADGNSSGVGFAWVGAARLTQSFTLLGAPIWVDVGMPGLLVPAVGGSYGLVRIPIAVPAATPTGATVYVQFVFSEPGCKVPLFASQGLQLTTF